MKSTQFYSTFARDKIFGSLGTSFQYKWKGIGYAHLNDYETTQQAIHWARLAAKQDPETVTFLAIPNTDWYQNQSPYTEPFPDAHTIIHFAADTITYDVPTISNEPNKTSNETRAIHILCIHHQHNNIGTTNQINTINTTIGNLQISQYHTHIVPPTPPNTKVNKNTKWNKLTYPPYNTPQNIWVDPLPNFEIHTTLKFSAQYSYYTDGSFLPPKEAEDGHWKKEKIGYGIYNPTKPNVQISKKTPWTTNMLQSRTNGHP